MLKRRTGLGAFLASIGALTIAAAVAPSAAHAASLEATIEAVNNKFGAAYDAGNAAAIAALYTEQATVFPPGQPMAHGRDAIRTVWAGIINSGAKITSLKTVSVESFGRAAREIGQVTMQVPQAGKPPAQVSGKYLVVWKRVRGVWMLDCDIWNLDQ